MTINNQFQIGEYVYFTTDTEQRMLLVTGILIRQNGISYEVSYNGDGTWVNPIEISKEKDETFKFSDN